MDVFFSLLFLIVGLLVAVPLALKRQKALSAGSPPVHRSQRLAAEIRQRLRLRDVENMDVSKVSRGVLAKGLVDGVPLELHALWIKPVWNVTLDIESESPVPFLLRPRSSIAAGQKVRFPNDPIFETRYRVTAQSQHKQVRELFNEERRRVLLTFPSEESLEMTQGLLRFTLDVQQIQWESEARVLEHLERTIRSRVALVRQLFEPDLSHEAELIAYSLEAMSRSDNPSGSRDLSFLPPAAAPSTTISESLLDPWSQQTLAFELTPTHIMLRDGSGEETRLDLAEPLRVSLSHARTTSDELLLHITMSQQVRMDTPDPTTTPTSTTTGGGLALEPRGGGGGARRTVRIGVCTRTDRLGPSVASLPHLRARYPFLPEASATALLAALRFAMASRGDAERW